MSSLTAYGMHMGGSGYGLIGVLMAVLLVVLIIYFVRRI
jgi:hypothetical protein